MENKLVCGSQNYCWLVRDQILISCKNMIIHLYNSYDVVVLDFVIFCLNVKMYNVKIHISILCKWANLQNWIK